MARVELIRCTDPARLLEHAAEGFLVHQPGTGDVPFPSPAYLLALRQGGVRDDLFALAAARGVPGWFDPPLCVFSELPEWLGRTAREPCGEFERAVLIASVVKRAARAVFGRLKHHEDFLDAVERWFGELAAEGVAPAAYEAALARLGARDDFERSRDADLLAAYRLYQSELETPRHNRAAYRDGRDTLADCAAAVREDPAGLAKRLGGRREIRLFGLADLRSGWRLLLRALAASPVLDRLVIYGAHPLDLDAGLDVLVTTLPAEQRARGSVHIVATPDAERESEDVAWRVRAAVERGVPLAEIAVVTRQVRPYQDSIIRALERAGVPATARRRVAYREVPVLRALFALLDAAAEGWSRHGLVELAEQPYFTNDLDSTVLNFAGYRARITGLAAWSIALADLEQDARHREAIQDDDEDEYRGALPPAARIAGARERFEAFAALAHDLLGERPLAGWLDWLSDFLTRDPWKLRAAIYAVPARRHDLARVDLRGLRDLEHCVREWRAAVERWGGAEERLAAGAFRQRLAQVLSGDAVFSTVTQRGVRVLEAHAAAYRTFAHVFLVGLTAGRFPLKPPVSPIIDATERDLLTAAGLPLDRRETWNAREQELFNVVVAGGRDAVTLCYPRLDASGWDLARSAFVDAMAADGKVVAEQVPTDRVVMPGTPLYSAPNGREEAARIARIELTRQAGRPSPHNGIIDDPALRAWLEVEFGDARVWSPTQLESYAKCPWSYFSNRLLRIEKREEPEDELDPATRGAVLHDALARFFTRATERLGKPVLLRSTDLTWAQPLAVAALDEAVTAAGAGAWLGHPALRDAKREELRRMLLGYLTFEVEHNDKMFNNRTQNAHLLRTAAAAHELGFDDAVLERGGLRIRFRGAIDRVEISVDDRIADTRFVAAVDYKASLGGVPGSGGDAAWDDGVVLQVPLYAHALAALRAGARVARVQYRTLRPPAVAHSLELYKIDRKTKVLHSEPDGMEKMERALDAAVAHVKAARGGTFPAAPKPSCGCPPFCHAWDICRVKGGPRTRRDL